MLKAADSGVVLHFGKGIFNRVEKTVPLEKITDVGLEQGPVMRYLGLRIGSTKRDNRPTSGDKNDPEPGSFDHERGNSIPPSREVGSSRRASRRPSSVSSRSPI